MKLSSNVDGQVAGHGPASRAPSRRSQVDRSFTDADLAERAATCRALVAALLA